MKDIAIRCFLVEIMVLEELNSARIKGEDLIRKISSKAKKEFDSNKDFDFVHWSGKTIYELLDWFIESKIIGHEGEQVPHLYDYSGFNQSNFWLTMRGDEYLKVIKERVKNL